MSSENVKDVVILAGGKGTRMRELTESLPKPMVQIGERPVLDHLIEIFDTFGKFNYFICTGYRSEIIEDYYKSNSRVKIVYTGEETNTGGRVYKTLEFLGENFIVTYGDGLANVNISKLLQFHFFHKKIATVTVTNPVSRFGLIEFDDQDLNKVTSFVEKPKLSGYVNMGYFVFNKKIKQYLTENSILELDPLVKLTSDSELHSFIHDGYFEPMDTYREYINMNKSWEKGEKPWLNF